MLTFRYDITQRPVYKHFRKHFQLVDEPIRIRPVGAAVWTFQIAVRFWTVTAGIGRLGGRGELFKCNKNMTVHPNKRLEGEMLSLLESERAD